MNRKKNQIASLITGSPLYKPAKHIGELIAESSISACSGQTAFFIVLSFFPYMLFLFAILRLTPLTEESFVKLLLTLFPVAFHDFINSLIHDIYSASNIQILSISIITAIWLGSKAFLCLAQGLHTMYQSTDSKNFITTRIFSFLYSIGFAILLIAALTLLVFGRWLRNYIVKFLPVLDTTLSRIIDLRLLIGFLLFFSFFLLMYRFLSDCRWSLRHHIPGAVLATLGWLIYSALYSYYVNHFSNYSSFYGTMSTFALLMVWLYACIYILFLGGILNRALMQRREARD